MTEQDKDFSGNFTFASLEKKDRPGLLSDLGERIKEELASNTP